MKRILSAALICVAFACNGLAQDATANSPATKEDVERYFQVVHSHDQVKKVADVMAASIHKAMHDRYIKDKDKLPSDFETRINKEMDDMFKSMPFDEIQQAMVPAYQKHFTKGDMDAMVAFYTSQTGQKLLQELPAIMGEAMETIMPIMRKQMETIDQRLQQEVADMIKKSDKKPDENKPAT